MGDRITGEAEPSQDACNSGAADGALGEKATALERKAIKIGG